MPSDEFITFKFHLNHIKQIMLRKRDDTPAYLAQRTIKYQKHRAPIDDNRKEGMENRAE